MHVFIGASFIMDYDPYLWIIVMFLSDSHSDGTHSLHTSIGEQVMQCYISPNLMKKRTRLHLGWTKGEDIVSKCSVLSELLLQMCVTSLFSYFNNYPC